MVVGDIKQALDARLGRTVALASAYDLLPRHGWRTLAPRHATPPGRRGRSGGLEKLASRLGQIDRQWQGDGPIRLMFQDEARFGRVSDTRRCWCPKPIRPLCCAMVTQEYTYATPQSHWPTASSTR